MARKRFTTEQIIGMLREAEVRLGQGQWIGVICKGLRVSHLSLVWQSDRIVRQPSFFPIALIFQAQNPKLGFDAHSK